jgi:hypothetical protein
MAMYLQQKDVEATVLPWIQAACILMIGDINVETASSIEDISELLVVLKGQQDEWKTVCSLCIIPVVLSPLLQTHSA